MKKSKKNIAFLYEGVKAEDELLENLKQNFFAEQADISIFTLPADGNIYMLWTRLKKDDFETDVIDILCEMSSVAKQRIKEANLKSSDFSEIYLFFDYDGHNNNIPQEYRGSDILGELLEIFNNETEFGKLYISYPMIEAIKEVDMEKADYKRLHIPLDEIGNYKNSFFEKSSCGKYTNLDQMRWKILCYASQKRAMMIVSYKEICSYQDFIKKLGQKQIYKAEKEHYINNGRQLAILNSVPLFLLEYYDEDFWDSVISSV